MKTKTKKGKAIIGIAMAAIMLASVLVAMVPTGMSRATATQVDTTDTIFIGEQGLTFDLTNAAGTGAPDGTYGDVITLEAVDEDIADTLSLSAIYTVPSVTEGKYYYDVDTSGIFDAGDTYIFVKKGAIIGDIILNEATQDSIVGKSIPTSAEIVFKAEMNFGGLGKLPGADFKITVTDPTGVVIETIDGQALTNLDATLGTTVFIGDRPTTTAGVTITAPPYTDAIDLTDLKTGTYTVQIKSDKTDCNMLDVSSSEMEFTIRSEELSITATEDTIGKGEEMVLSVSGNPKSYYYLIVTGIKRSTTTSVAPEIMNTEDVKARDGLGNAHPAIGTEIAETNLAAWIKTGSDGIADVKIDATGADERTYTIKVYDTAFVNDPDAIGGATYDEDGDVDASGLTTDDAEVKVKVEKAKVTFDLPASVIIGEEVTIKGSISAGDKVDIVIKDQEVVDDDKAVDENNEFEVKWDTEGYTTGSYTIEGYIDFLVGGAAEVIGDFDGEDDDGRTTIRLVEPGLTAEQPRAVIAEEDDYELKGTATGVDEVDYILIGPKGWKTGVAADIDGGILKSSASVSDNEFGEEELMTDGLDTGTWIAMIFAPGRDSEYEGTGQAAGDLTLAALGVVDGKNQDQVVAIIVDVMTQAGSDDLFETLKFKVESAYVELNPVASVAAGEPLNISGTTNREPETSITISTFAGPMDLNVGLADVTWPTASEGVFTATIDTTDAVPGTYTLEADDGDGHTDSIDVQILSAVPVTETPVVEVTPTPEVEVTPTPEVPVVEATPTPKAEEPTPTPTPGFEMVFAIAGLLAVAYLVLRKRK